MAEHRNGSSVELTRQQLRALKNRVGFRFVFYNATNAVTKGKGPLEKEWTESDDVPETLPEGYNVGFFSGERLTHPEGREEYGADVDIDDVYLENFLNPRRAERILPPTAWAFTRDGRIVTHLLYATPVPLPSKEFKCPVRGHNLVEIRGTKTSDTEESGHQTMIPPSKVANGARRWLNPGPDGLPPDRPGYTEVLTHRCALLAIVGVLGHFLGTRAFDHKVRLGYAAWFLGLGLSVEDVVLLGENLAEALSNDPNGDDVRRTVASTAEKLKSGTRVQYKAFTDALGEHSKTILDGFRAFLGIKETKPRKGGQADIQKALDDLGITLAYNSFALRFELTRDGATTTMEDFVIDQLWLEIERRFGFLPRIEYFQKVLYTWARERNSYHPILDIFAKLPPWDNVPRVERWLIDGASAPDTPYVRAVSALPLIAAVRRVRNAARRPAVSTKFDEMLVLESATQGFFKSTALRELCPGDGQYFTDDFSLNSGTKELIEQTGGKFIIEASDLNGFTRSETTKLKSMLSRQVDGPVRLAYARTPIEVPRQFVIIGTTNTLHYLKDPTGNRRFWPVEVQRFDIEWIRANKEQIWAEAVAREAAGEPIRLDPRLWTAAGKEQAKRQIPNAWLEALTKHFGGTYYRLLLEDFWDVLNIPMERRTAQVTAQLVEALEALGFKRMDVKDKGKTYYGWGKGTSADKAREDREKKTATTSADTGEQRTLPEGNEKGQEEPEWVRDHSAPRL